MPIGPSEGRNPSVFQLIRRVLAESSSLDGSQLGFAIPLDAWRNRLFLGLSRWARFLPKSIQRLTFVINTSKMPVHPGRILRETVLPEAGISVEDAALALGESVVILQNILAEQMSLSAVLCLKIAKLSNSTPELWIRLQANHDLQKALQDENVARSLESIVPALPRSNALA